jgi:hypothetical protein
MSTYPVAVGQLWQDDVPTEQYPRTLRVERIKTSLSGVEFARVVVVYGGKNPGTGRWQYSGQTGYIRLDRLCSDRYKFVQDAQTTPAMPKRYVYTQSQVFPTASSPKEEIRCISMPGMFFEYLEAQRPGWRQYSTDRLSRMLQSWQAGYASGLKACEAGLKGQKV